MMLVPNSSPIAPFRHCLRAFAAPTFLGNNSKTCCKGFTDTAYQPFTATPTESSENHQQIKNG
ncbi:MAG: hypothetical protein BGN96_15365 [Bacteroidales bacterium 45-6]|nr:MAG: hypothetical protein BGN96_15365 [Bacteroidales bacterium 45-6]